MENVKSTHKAEVVPVNLEAHPDADSLSVFQVFGYSYVAKTENWLGVKKAAFLPPDTLVDTTRPEFSFFSTERRLYEVKGRKVYYRIKAKKIRGVVSYGFCVPVPNDTDIGEDWFDKLGLIHFDEDEHSTKQKGVALGGGEVESPPDCYFIKYDVDSLRRYKEVMIEGEPVWVSEKQHGSNSKFVFNNDKMYCGSRGEWKREYASPPNYDNIEARMREKLNGKVSEEEITNKLVEIKKKVDNWNPTQNAWWKVYHKYEGIGKFCKENPNYVLYGELLGSQDLRYGVKPGEVGFSAFDILKPDGQFMNVSEFLLCCQSYNIPVVPTIALKFPFNFEQICEMAEGNTLIEGVKQVREGCVVKPMIERVDSKIGRVCLKVVGAGYLERV